MEKDKQQWNKDVPRDPQNHRIFAVGLVPSMKRRAEYHDYHIRCIYHITLVVEQRHPYLGQLVGDPDAPYGSSQAPRIILSPLGIQVSVCWHTIPKLHPEIKLITCQVMPDHFHGLLFVQEEMEDHIGVVIRGFKQGCNKAFNDLMPVEAEEARQAQQKDNNRGFLFERNYNDTILLGKEQLSTLHDYILDNPYRLALRRLHREYFHVYPAVSVAGVDCSVLGNVALLLRKDIRQVRVSRRATDEQIDAKKHELMEAGRNGAVLASPAISPGEKAIMRAALDGGLSLIYIMDNGLDSMFKPHKAYFNPCAEGRMLFISPFPHSNCKQELSRERCDIMNALAFCLEHRCEFERKDMLNG